MTIITEIRLFNFKRFRKFTLFPNKEINIIVGENEVGKSSILEAIDIVSNGNRRPIESIGIDKLFNVNSINDFNSGERTFQNLPEMRIELYLDGITDYKLEGNNNSKKSVSTGIKLVCAPNKDFINEINECLSQNNDYFPFEYYEINFTTFSGEHYTGYKKKLNSIFVDSSDMNSDYVTDDFVRKMYLQYTEVPYIKERAIHKSKYRMMQENFVNSELTGINNRVSNKSYKFKLKNYCSTGIENELTICENDVEIDSRGTGKQIFIKTDFVLENSDRNTDIFLMEEPENHLSHINLRKLIQKIIQFKHYQLFITTHNSLISTRLELKNIIILSSDINTEPLKLDHLNEDTVDFFIKAPPANILEFTLSKKVVLVEGPSEYILMEKFYKDMYGSLPEEDDIHIMDIRGLSFKRYLEIASRTNTKVAVLTDNDGDYQKNCIEKYSDYEKYTNIKIFYETNNLYNTFEKCIFESNKELCEVLFKNVDKMIKNKTDTALMLLEKEEKIVIPNYIKESLKWIKE